MVLGCELNSPDSI